MVKKGVFFERFSHSTLKRVARKINLCANEDFNRALNVTIEFAKRAQLFDWLFRPQLQRQRLSAKSRSLTASSRHRKFSTVAYHCHSKNEKESTFPGCKTAFLELTKK